VKRLEVARHIAADPASVALLLADPSGAGAPEAPPLRVADDGFEVSPPRRSGVGFVADVIASDRDGRPVYGEIRVEPAADPGCDVRIGLNISPDANASAAQRSATKFLSALADRARSRSFAA
jgi:hypothetical protein